jgi:hypothetical protein
MTRSSPRPAGHGRPELDFGRTLTVRRAVVQMNAVKCDDVVVELWTDEGAAKAQYLRRRNLRPHAPRAEWPDSSGQRQPTTLPEAAARATDASLGCGPAVCRATRKPGASAEEQGLDGGAISGSGLHQARVRTVDPRSTPDLRPRISTSAHWQLAVYSCDPA